VLSVARFDDVRAILRVATFNQVGLIYAVIREECHD
jgi:hypothetical protein